MRRALTVEVKNPLNLHLGHIFQFTSELLFLQHKEPNTHDESWNDKKYFLLYNYVI